MNTLQAKIVEVLTVDQFSAVKLKVADEFFTALIIEIPDLNPDLTIGNVIKILFKETDVTLSLEMPKLISASNKIPVVVKAIETGVLLSRVIVAFNGILINAVVFSDFASQLKVGDDVVMLIGSNEIMLMDDFTDEQ